MLKPDAFPDQVAALCDAGKRFGERGWVMATGGNFSARLSDGTILITRSGVDKTTLGVGDLMICDSNGNSREHEMAPSAETPLHARLYGLYPEVNSVLHTHSITTTVLSRVTKSDLHMRGFEMQKALSGVSNPELTMCLPVFDNDQDMNSLAFLVEKRLGSSETLAPAFLVRGHGLYAWGSSVAQAIRHIEGIEFLCACLWQEHLAGKHDN